MLGLFDAAAEGSRAAASAPPKPNIELPSFMQQPPRVAAPPAEHAAEVPPPAPSLDAVLDATLEVDPRKILAAAVPFTPKERAQHASAQQAAGSAGACARGCDARRYAGLVQLPLLVLGACVDVIAATMYISRRLFIARAVRVDGVVVGHRTQRSEGDEGYAPIVSYVVEGTAHQVESGMFTHLPRELGSPMVVFHTPRKAILEQSGTKMFTLGIALAGVGLTLGGALAR